jgi:hypothetical protein
LEHINDEDDVDGEFESNMGLYAAKKKKRNNDIFLMRWMDYIHYKNQGNPTNA